jgi:AcrR family transcriptional regulator
MTATHQGKTMSNGSAPRRVGRPRAFQDDDVYRVMTNVIGDVGYSGLTFALIATQIRCTTSALIRRFGDKRSLVQGFILWLAGRQDEAFQRYRDKQVSPLNMLRARWFIPTQPRTKIDDMPEKPELFLSFFIEARSEPAYRPQLAKLTGDFEAGVRQAIREATQAGELVNADPADLAHTLNCAMTGAISHWMDHQRGPLANEMELVFNSVVRPYQPGWLISD